MTALQDSFTILIDTREQTPFAFERWPVKTERAGLPTGDYSLPGFQDQAAVERKSLDDLVGCFMGKDRERFKRELTRGRVMDLFAVVVEADLQDIARGRYQSQMKPQAALQTISAFFIRYGTPFLFCGDRTGGEYMTHALLSKYLYEIDKRFQQARKAAG